MSGLRTNPYIDEVSVRKTSINNLATGAFLEWSNTEEIQKLTIEYLTLLEVKMNHYFPSLTKSADWVVFSFRFTDKVNKLDHMTKIMSLWIYVSLYNSNFI